MGIHDRDYIRQPQRRGAGGFRMPKIAMTMTLWLIVINVGVFVLDGAVASFGRSVVAELGVLTNEAFSGDYDDLEEQTDGPVLPSLRGRGLFEIPLVDKTTSDDEVVATRLVTRMGPLEAIGFFSTVKISELEVWRFLTFQFLHANTTHLLFNMIGLFFFGPIAERYLGSRRLFLSFYLVCGMAGAGLYLLLNLAGALLPMQLPLVLANDPWVPLVGASAGVFGVLWAAAFVASDARMYVMGIIPMKIRTGVILFTVLAFWNLLTGGNNAGGDAAHLGGAIAGFFFIRNPHILLNFFDEFLRTSERHPKFQRGSKRVRGGPDLRLAGQSEPPTTAARQRKLNAILDKIRTQGEGALTPDERGFLERETDRRRKR